MEKYGDEDAKTSMRLWMELKPATDIKGVLGALALRDLLLQRWLTFLVDTPLGMDLTRDGQAKVLDSLRPCLIAPTLGLCGLAVPVGHYGRLRTGVQITAGPFREDLTLDAGVVIEAAEGIVAPIDPQGA